MSDPNIKFKIDDQGYLKAENDSGNSSGGYGAIFGIFAIIAVIALIVAGIQGAYAAYVSIANSIENAAMATSNYGVQLLIGYLGFLWGSLPAIVVAIVILIFGSRAVKKGMIRKEQAAKREMKAAEEKKAQEIKAAKLAEQAALKEAQRKRLAQEKDAEREAFKALATSLKAKQMSIHSSMTSDVESMSQQFLLDQYEILFKDKWSSNMPICREDIEVIDLQEISMADFDTASLRKLEALYSKYEKLSQP